MFTDPTSSGSSLVEERIRQLEAVIASFLSGASRAVELVDLNIAAGIAQEELKTA